MEQIVSILGKYGQGGAAVEEYKTNVIRDKVYMVKIYVPHSRRYKEVKREIETSLKSFNLQLSEHILKPEDWLDSLRDHFHPFEIGEKLMVTPRWVDKPVPQGRIAIKLDPGAAFGTGLHPTTRLCLLRLERHLEPGMFVLDLGTGTGILSIAAAKLGAGPILALDIDAVAVRAAVYNAGVNSVGDLVKIRRGTLSLRMQMERKDNFGMVLANISAGAISSLAPGFFKVLKSKGIFIGTGIHSQQLDEVLIKLAIAGFQLIAIDSEEEWRAITAQKP